MTVTSTNALVGKSLDGPTYKLSTAVFIKDGDTQWVPAEIISFQELADRNVVEVVLSPDPEDVTSSNAWAITSVDLSTYPNQTLPLQEVDEYGRRVVHADLTDMQYLHEAGILYNLKDRYCGGDQCHPYTRAGSVVIAMNPYEWIDGMYDSEMKQYYADRLVWRPFMSPNGVKSLEPHVYEVSSLAYKGLLMNASVTNDSEIKDQAILISGESGSGKTETVKILMNHLATFESTKYSLVSNDPEHVGTVIKCKKNGFLRRVRSSAIKKLTRVASFHIPSRIKLKKTKTEETSKSSSSSLTGTEEGQTSMDSPKKSAEFFDGSNDVVNRILETNSILESFGNAKTVRNDNSSRFGKFIQMQFKVEKFPISSCKLVGSFCETYLLEKSRVTKHDSNERTFHVFYQLLSAPEELKADVWQHLVGTDASSFKYVGVSSTTEIEGMSDSDRFLETIGALDIVGVKGDLLEQLMKGLCCVLQLGNITFEDNVIEGCDGSIVSSPEELVLLADIMGIDDNMITDALTTATVFVQNEMFIKNVSKESAKERCDALAKAIYNKLFEWLVSFINDSTRAESNIDIMQNDGNIANIGLLDIFGFESFKTNRFEQLLINHANERLQSKFSEDIFVAVQQEYANQGIKIETVTFPDNSCVLQLLEGRMGLMSLLSEECILPKGNDHNYVAKIYKLKGQKSIFKEKAFRQHEFGVKHFAGKIIYTADQIVSKNQDFLPDELITCALSCKNTIITEMFQSLSSSNTNLAKQMSRKFSSLGAETSWGKFKCQLDSLMNKLSKTQTRYVRCIKPNVQKRPRYIEMSQCLEQIRCAGVVQAVTMSRQCFPNRLTFNKVYDLFGHMARKHDILTKKKGKIGMLIGKYNRNNKRNANDNEKYLVEDLLNSLFQGKESALSLFIDQAYDVEKYAPFVCGKSVAYFRSGALEFLEALRLSVFDKAATIIQCFVRKQKALYIYQTLRSNSESSTKLKKKRSMKRAIHAVTKRKFGRVFARTKKSSSVLKQ